MSSSFETAKEKSTTAESSQVSRYLSARLVHARRRLRSNVTVPKRQDIDKNREKLLKGKSENKTSLTKH